jgi:hypothetical protein
LCAVCGDARPETEAESDAQAHLLRCASVLADADGLAGLLGAVVRLGDALRRDRAIVRRLLAAPDRDLGRARAIESVRVLGGRATFDDVLHALHESPTRRLLARVVKDGGLRAERRGRKNGVATYSVEPLPDEAGERVA